MRSEAERQKLFEAWQSLAERTANSFSSKYRQEDPDDLRQVALLALWELTEHIETNRSNGEIAAFIRQRVLWELQKIIRTELPGGLQYIRKAKVQNNGDTQRASLHLDVDVLRGRLVSSKAKRFCTMVMEEGRTGYQAAHELRLGSNEIRELRTIFKELRNYG